MSQPNGRQPHPKCNKTKMEEDQNGRRPKWKTTKIEEDKNGRQPKKYCDEDTKQNLL